jgi:polyisoprenoid-binding protein YceI
MSAVTIKEQVSEFFASGRPSLIKIHGSSENHQEALELENEQLSGKVTVDLKTFETGMKFRDRHLKNKIFALEENPTASLSVDHLSLNDQSFAGMLDFHGVQKPVSGTQEFKKTNDQWNYAIHFKLDISDFGIEPPEFLGMKLNNEVHVEVHGTLH